MVYGLNRFAPLKWTGLAPTKYRSYQTGVKVRPVGSTKSRRPKANPATLTIRLTCLGYIYATCSGLGTWDALDWVHDIRQKTPSLYLSITMRPVAPRPPRPAGSPSSSASSGSSGSVHRERECSPHTPLPPPIPMPIHGPMHPPPRTHMMDARRYHNLFSRCRVAPLTPPPSDYEPSNEGDGDDPEDSQTASNASLSSRDVSSAGASHGSERESTSFSSGPSEHFLLGSSSGGSSVGSCSVMSGSTSDASSDDDLVNRYFAGTFPPP
ncbi:hypothetical protein PIB30_026494 [Stylosanthes scabra]|uniref:Uncharacterized protein n=1 Tax=Stylosanthes scabra TaxID=79078 RepID=A0ABU6X9L0_9FABA|nr:hypothetical protein [Stylosanthes scabra]